MSHPNWVNSVSQPASSLSEPWFHTPVPIALGVPLRAATGWEIQYGSLRGTLGFAGTQVLHGARPHSNTRPWDGGEPNLRWSGWTGEESPEHHFTPYPSMALTLAPLRYVRAPASLELSLVKGGREEVMATVEATLWGRGWLY